MKEFIGVLLIIAGAALGLYVGLWVMFVGGILGIVESLSGVGVDEMLLAWSIVKIVFAGFIGSLSAYLLMIPGYLMLVK